MSDADTSAHGPAAEHAEVPHASLKGYTIGFVLSVVLTAIPFWLVMTGAIRDHNVTILSITALAAVQIVVHMLYFLHLSPRAEGGWSLSALIFTAILVGIVLIGSIWVMYHLNVNMMPGQNQQMSEMG